MPQLGIIDLGSNNARMVVYEYEPGTWFHLVDDIREPVRLGEGLGRGGELTPAAIERGRAALDLFTDYAAAADLDELVTLGTSALRDASNRGAFERAIAHLDVEIRILSGEDEARAGVLAIANSFDLPGAWVMDLGGGSAQISRMRDRMQARGQAYPLGGVRLTEAFVHSDPPKRSEIKAIEEEIAAQLRPIAHAIRKDAAPIVAMGGTIRNLARASQKRLLYPLDLLHGYFYQRADLEEEVEDLLTKTSRQRSRVPGIHADRADVILAGALVYRWLLRETGRDGLHVSGHGVREGIFYQHFLPAPHLIPDVRRFSVENLARHERLDSEHTRHVRDLAAQLFAELAPLHGLGEREAQLLDAAAALHDIGIRVHFYRHPRHGAYVLGSDPLPGFGHREHVLVMQLVRYHHKGTPTLDAYRTLALPGDKRLLARLACCLRLAESLERSRARRVEAVNVAISEDAVTLRLLSAEDLIVEQWEARQHGELFAEAFGKRLVVERG